MHDATVRTRLGTFRGTLRDAVACVVAVVCCLSVGWWGVGFNGARPDVPIVYGGDAAQYSYLMEADLAGSLADIRVSDLN